MNNSLIIQTKDIPVYYINPDDFSNRSENIISTCKSISNSFTRINYNNKDIHRQNTITNAHLLLVETAISNNKFPFILLEDDAKICKQLPEEFNIPNNSSLIYLGGSLYNTGGAKPNLYITEYNSEWYRVFYMLSAHAILFPNLESALLYKNICIKSLSINNFHDVELALASESNIFLTPKYGLYIYQDSYNESITRFYWSNNLHLVQ